MHFVHSWVFNYVLPTDPIATNGKWFTSKFFLNVCRILNVHNYFTMTNDIQNDDQVESYNRNILPALGACINDTLREWDLYISSPTYWNNIQLQTSTSVAPFELGQRKPSGPIVALLPQPNTTALPTSNINGINRLRKLFWKLKQSSRMQYKRNFHKQLRKKTEKSNPETTPSLGSNVKTRKRHDTSLPQLRKSRSQTYASIKPLQQSLSNDQMSGWEMFHADELPLLQKSMSIFTTTNKHFPYPSKDIIHNYPVAEQTYTVHALDSKYLPTVLTHHHTDSL